MKKAAVAILILVGFVPPASAQSRRVTWEPFTFVDPSGARVNAERGWLEVPERHAARSEGPKVSLPIVRVRATAPGARTPIIFLAGGPGESGIQRLTGASYPLFERLRAYGDVIAFDQRGTGAAEPSLDVPGRFDLASDEPVDSADTGRRIAVVAATIRAAIRSRGIDLSAYNTSESADDIDALREALGAERVVLLGHGYGTHLGLAVIRRHGEHVERAIFGGVNGLNQRWGEPIEGDAWLTRIADRLRADGTEDFIGQVRRVLAGLSRDPILVRRDGGNVLIGKSEIQLLVALRGGDIEFVQALPTLFDDLEKRTRLDDLATAVQQTIRQRPIGTATSYAMHAASGVSYIRRDRIAAQAPAAVLGNAMNWCIGDETFLDVLGVDDLGDEFREPFRSTVPVLLISATLDGKTSDANAREVGQQFARAVYITLEGASHDFLFRRDASQLVLDTMGAFLRGDALRDQRIQVPVQFRGSN